MKPLEFRGRRVTSYLRSMDMLLQGWILRIEKVESFPIRVKMREKRQASTFSYPDYQTVLLRVEVDGVEGWGEAMTRFGPRATSSMIEDSLSEIVNRKEFGSPREARDAIWRALRVRGHTRGIAVEAMSGIEIGLWDAYGKLKKKPLAALLSKTYATRLPALAGSLFASRGPIQPQVAMAKSEGVLGAKVKIGFGIGKDLEILRTARRAWEEGKLVADANGSYSASQAIRLIDKLKPFGLEWLEEPVPADDLEGYGKIAHRGVPIGAGETWFVDDFQTPLKDRLVDVVEPSVSRSGGIELCREVSVTASKMGVRFAPMVGANSAISLAASMHLAAVADNLVGVEFDLFGNPLVGEFAPGFLELRNGELLLPNKPGLGISPDIDFVRDNSSS